MERSRASWNQGGDANSDHASQLSVYDGHTESLDTVICLLTFEKTFQKFHSKYSHDSIASNSTEGGAFRRIGKEIKVDQWT